MTINPSSYDYAVKDDYATRRAYEVNSAQAIEAVKGVSDQDFYTPVEPVKPVSYASENIDYSTSTADLGNLTPEMEKILNPAPTPTSSTPTKSQESTEPRNSNSSDYNPADELRDQVRAMRNTRPPESGESIASNVERGSVAKENPVEKAIERYGVGSDEGKSDVERTLDRIA